jgi:hypothetical protein
LQHKDELLRYRGVVDPATGLLWAVDLYGVQRQVTFEGGVDPRFRNLINSSFLLNATANNAQEGMLRLAEWLEDVGGEQAVASVLTLQAALNVATRCAVEGIEKIAGT